MRASLHKHRKIKKKQNYMELQNNNDSQSNLGCGAEP